MPPRKRPGSQVVDDATIVSDKLWSRFLPKDFGHLVTLLGSIIVVATTYNSMDKRITILEEQNRQLMSALSSSQGTNKESIGEIKSDVKILKETISSVQTTLSVMNFKVDQISLDRVTKGK